MPSSKQPWRTAGTAVALLVLCYAVLIVGKLLVGLLTAVLAYVVGWTLDRVGTGQLVARMGPLRAAVTGVFGVATVGYGVVVVERPLLALALALLGFVLAWLTAPDGPLARLARWALAAREDLRVVRERLVDDDQPPAEND